MFTILPFMVNGNMSASSNKREHELHRTHLIDVYTDVEPGDTVLTRFPVCMICGSNLVSELLKPCPNQYIL